MPWKLFDIRHASRTFHTFPTLAAFLSPRFRNQVGLLRTFLKRPGIRYFQNAVIQCLFSVNLFILLLLGLVHFSPPIFPSDRELSLTLLCASHCAFVGTCGYRTRTDLILCDLIGLVRTIPKQTTKNWYRFPLLVTCLGI